MFTEALTKQLLLRGVEGKDLLETLHPIHPQTNELDMKNYKDLDVELILDMIKHV